MADDEMMTDALPTGGGGFDWADDVAAEHAASGHDAAVLEAEKEKARKRAERFGQEYKEPKANAIARGLMSRKEVLAMRKERALKKMTDACQPDRQRSCPIIDALSATSP